jgi:hypothetical protein
MARGKSKSRSTSTSEFDEPEVPIEVWDFLTRERKLLEEEYRLRSERLAKSETKPKSRFKAMLSRFVEMAKGGEEQLVNATVTIELKEPMEGSSSKSYQSSGWNKINLSNIEFVDDDGITFYPKGSERGNPMIYVAWDSVSHVILK